MSRWMDTYKNHAFQRIWTKFKKELSETKIDDETQTSSVIELARLKKVTIFIDKLLDGIDIELVPLETWNNFQSQITPCFQQLQSYNSNRNIGHIQNANSHADNLLTYVRPYMVSDLTATNAIQKSLEAYSNSIKESIETFTDNTTLSIKEIKENLSITNDLTQQIKQTKSSLDSLFIEIFGSKNKEGKRDKMNEMFSDIENRNQKIEEFYSNLLVGTEEKISIKKDITRIKDEIEQDKKQIKQSLDQVSANIKDLDEFHDKIFGGVNLEGEAYEGLSQELERRLDDLSDLEKDQKEKYQTLIEKIQSLLPGATSAGLASSYNSMKTVFDRPIIQATSLFYFSIFLLIIISFASSISKVGIWYIDFVDFKDWSIVLKSLLFKTPLYGPIIWLAFFASKRRSEYQRLQQEYAHKEALAQSYESYKNQLEKLDLDDPVLQARFISRITDAFAFNPSTTLDKKHGDKMPSQDVVEKTFETINGMKRRDDS